MDFFYVCLPSKKSKIVKTIKLKIKKTEASTITNVVETAPTIRIPKIEISPIKIFPIKFNPKQIATLIAGQRKVFAL